MRKAILEVRNLSKTYRLGNIGISSFINDLRRFSRKLGFQSKKYDNTKDFVALDNISFSLNPGEVLGIIGPNGAGKSTLLKILSRITEPSSGQAILRGRVSSLLEVGTGFHEDMTGRENIFLNGSLHGLTSLEIKRELDSIIDFAQVEKFIDTPVKRYSSGMFVRLAFAVAAHLKPEILIVDEVLAVGDADFQKRCIGKMKSVSESGRTVLFVSHQLNMIKNLCTRGILLDNGKLIYDGTVDKTLDKYLNKKGKNFSEYDLSARKDRSGKGNYRIEKIHFKSIDTKLNSFATGSDVVISVTIKTINYYKTYLECAFAITDSNGSHISDLSNFFTNEKLPSSNEETFIISCAIPKLSINSGKYNINCWLSTDIELEDYIINAGVFEIKSGDFFGTGKNLEAKKGSVLLNQKWFIPN